MFKTGAQMFLLVLLAGFFLLRESQQAPCSTFDERFAAWTALNGPARRPDRAPLTLVAIDDNHRGPLDFSLFAETSKTFHSDVTAFGEILEWDHPNGSQGGERPKQFQLQYENILQDTLLRVPKVLLAARLGWPEDPQSIPPLQELPLIRKVAGNLRAIPEWTVIEREPKEEYRLPASLGFVNLPADSQPLQAVPLVLRYQGEVVPTLVLQSIVMWKKLSLDDVSVELGSHLSVGDKLEIPIDEAGQMRVNFGVPWNEIAFDDLVLAKSQADAKIKPAAPVDRMAGGITLLARTDAPVQTISSGTGRKCSEGQLFAAAIATIQKQAFVRRAPYWFDLSIIGIIAVLSLWIPQRKKLTMVTAGSITIIVYGLSAIAFFAEKAIWVPIVLPVGLILFTVAYRLATPNPSATEGGEEAPAEPATASRKAE